MERVMELLEKREYERLAREDPIIPVAVKVEVLESLSQSQSQHSSLSTSQGAASQVQASQSQQSQSQQSQDSKGKGKRPRPAKKLRLTLGERLAGDAINPIDAAKPDANITKEVEGYLASPITVKVGALDWWKTSALLFSMIARLAREYLSIPPTEVSN